MVLSIYPSIITVVKVLLILIKNSNDKKKLPKPFIRKTEKQEKLQINLPEHNTIFPIKLIDFKVVVQP
jgi:hypothetical protein